VYAQSTATVTLQDATFADDNETPGLGQSAEAEQNVYFSESPQDVAVVTPEGTTQRGQLRTRELAEARQKQGAVLLYGNEPWLQQTNEVRHSSRA
jgi:hypothetical protein